MIAELVGEKLRDCRKSGGVKITTLNKQENNKRKVQTVNQERNAKYYSVSEKKEVYLCVNALNKEHDCDFGLCRDCYLKKEPKRKRRTKRTEDDDSRCKHKCYASLHQFFDKQFFNRKYINQLKQRDIAWTTFCSICKVKFVSTGRNGQIN